jgi:hypothetical protein
MVNLMKKGIWVVVLCAFAAVNTASAQEYKKITRLGTSEAICAGGIDDLAGLQQFVAENPSAIIDILNDSGWAGDANAVLAAISAGNLNEVSLPVGTQFAWMGAKVKGKNIAKPYREWAGKKSVPAYQFIVESNGVAYDMAIPKVCCNLALLGATKVAAPVVAAPVAAPAPVEAAPEASLIPFLGLFVGSETRPRYEPAWDMDQVDSSGIVGLRAGLLHKLSEKTSLLGQLSYYDRTSVNEGNIYPEDNFAIDLGVERKLSEKASIGGGIGAWNVDDSDFRDTSLFAHVVGDIGETSAQWFVEGRVFDSDSATRDSISDNKMFSLGIRYLVK